MKHAVGTVVIEIVLLLLSNFVHCGVWVNPSLDYVFDADLRVNEKNAEDLCQFVDSSHVISANAEGLGTCDPLLQKHLFANFRMTASSLVHVDPACNAEAPIQPCFPTLSVAFDYLHNRSLPSSVTITLSEGIHIVERTLVWQHPFAKPGTVVLAGGGMSSSTLMSDSVFPAAEVFTIAAPLRLSSLTLKKKAVTVSGPDSAIRVLKTTLFLDDVSFVNFDSNIESIGSHIFSAFINVQNFHLANLTLGSFWKHTGELVIDASFLASSSGHTLVLQSNSYAQFDFLAVLGVDNPLLVQGSRLDVADLSIGNAVVGVDVKGRSTVSVEGGLISNVVTPFRVDEGSLVTYKGSFDGVDYLAEVYLRSFIQIWAALSEVYVYGPCFVGGAGGMGYVMHGEVYNLCVDKDTDNALFGVYVLE
eukprot:GCRY01001640.1.p1 GENE.GCRY01001640.1~~GCRY01001640.1.p1  ORF type:complete len:418 (-),score=75.80 GCRY01001640.1:54-1307(-)